MIAIPVVGEYDCNTKESILRSKGAISRKMINLTMVSGDLKAFKKITEIWPGSATYEIVSVGGQRYGDPWYGPIDLGDDVKLGFLEFINMVHDQFEDKEYSRDEVAEYLQNLISKDLELYKFMAKMKKFA